MYFDNLTIERNARLNNAFGLAQVGFDYHPVLKNNLLLGDHLFVFAYLRIGLIQIAASVAPNNLHARILCVHVRTLRLRNQGSDLKNIIAPHRIGDISQRIQIQPFNPSG